MCDEHRSEQRRFHDSKRSHSAHRGYDSTWEKLRLLKLREDPLCECDKCKASGRVVAAEVVDHILPVSLRPDLRLVWENLRSMSKRCHDSHTINAQGANAMRRT